MKAVNGCFKKFRRDWQGCANVVQKAGPVDVNAENLRFTVILFSGPEMKKASSKAGLF
jgi:hypothetical protein